MRMKKRTLALRISIFILVFAGATFGAYILTPNRTRRVVQDTNINEKTDRTTALSRFITKLRGMTEYHAKDEYKLSTHVDVKDLAFTWPSEGLVDNSLLLNAGVDLVSKGLADIKFSAEANVNYNNECVDLGAGYINDTMYLALDSFKVKSTMKDTTQLMDKLKYYLFDPENENGLGLRLDVFEKLDEILSNFDSEELLSNVDLNTLCIDESEELDFNKVSIYNDDLTDGFSIDVDLLLNKKTDDLMLLDLKTLEIDDFSVSGKIAFTYDKNLQIYGLDDANYPVKRGEFPELINYSSWIDRTFELLNSRKFGLNFTANISEVDRGVKAPMINIDLDSNIDFSQVIDFKNISSLTSISAESLLGKLYFDAVLKLNDSQNNNLMNIQTALLNNTGYVSINDDGTNSDLRAKISVAQISNLVGKISSYINKETSADSFDLDQVFDEIINGDLVDAINNKNYEKIIKFINGIENTKDTVKISLNLSLLGFGETSKLELILNSKSNGDNSNQVVEISAKNLKISNICMDFDLTIQNFVNSIKERIEHDNLQNKYINFDFIPDIFDQAEELINTPKSGFALNGFVYDKSEDQFGFSFHGDGQFDYLAKKGFGSIVFNAKTEKRTSEHRVDINVDNSSPDENEDNMFFAYNTKLKGKFNIRTLNDIIELIEEILSSDDPRFTKFLNPINASLTESLIGAAIKSEDYLSLLNNKIFKQISMDEASQEMTIILSKDLLGLDTDLLLNIGFITQNNKSQIKYIAFAFNTKEKQIYFNLVINPYDESKKAKLDISDINEFMDFSDIKILLDFGIRTTKLGVYNLKAEATASILGLFSTKIPLDFYIEVNGESTKVYGQALISPLLSQIGRSSHTVYSEFVFEPGYIEGDNIGGLIHMVRTDVKNSNGTVSNKYYWVTDTDNFMDNIIPYLCKDFFTLQSIAYSQIEQAAGKQQATKDPVYENMFVQPFVYSTTDTEHIWKTTLSLEALTGNTNLGNLSIDLRGSLINGEGYFTKVTVDTTFVSLISLNATINLVDIDPELTSWDGFNIALPGGGNSTVLNRYNFITGIFAGMSEADINTYFNKPLKSYTSF